MPRLTRGMPSVFVELRSEHSWTMLVFRLPGSLQKKIVLKSLVRSGCARYHPRRTGPTDDPQASCTLRQQPDRYFVWREISCVVRAVRRVPSTTSFRRVTLFSCCGLRAFESCPLFSGAGCSCTLPSLYARSYARKIYKFVNVLVRPDAPPPPSDASMETS